MTLFSAQELLRAKEKMAAEREAFVAKLEQAQQELVESKNRITGVEHNFEEANKERMTVSHFTHRNISTTVDPTDSLMRFELLMNDFCCYWDLLCIDCHCSFSDNSPRGKTRRWKRRNVVRKWKRSWKHQKLKLSQRNTRNRDSKLRSRKMKQFKISYDNGWESTRLVSVFDGHRQGCRKLRNCLNRSVVLTVI